MSFSHEFALPADAQNRMRQQFLFQQSQQLQTQPPQGLDQHMYVQQMGGFPHGYQQDPRWAHEFTGQMPMHPYSMQSFPVPQYHLPPGMHFAVQEEQQPSSKARLTRTQVDYLEGQYQQNPKPDSRMKKTFSHRLAIHPLKVTNWFQNRRAKTKQMRIQEERAKREAAGESQQEPETQADAEDEQDDGIGKEDNGDEVKKELELEDSRENKAASLGHESTNSEATAKLDVDQDTKPTVGPAPIGSPDQAAENRKRMFESFDRAMRSARSAQTQAFTDPPQFEVSNLESHGQLHGPSVEAVQNHYNMQTGTGPSVMHMAGPTRITNVPQHHQSPFHDDLSGAVWDPSQLSDANAAHLSAPFDFGFSLDTPAIVKPQSAVASPTDTGSNAFTSEWSASVNTPDMSETSHAQLPSATAISTQMAPPEHCDQRSHSISDSVADNLDGMEIRNRSAFTSTSPESSENGVDLASRRRRPRPAALTTVSLRSRSYGAASAASPTFRSSLPSPAGQALRHVRSAGHGLNNRCVSGRVQKSPYSQHTFADAEYRALMTRNAMKGSGLDTPSGMLTAVPTQNTFVGTSMPSIETQIPKTGPVSQQMPVQSPPVTPFNQNFFGQPISSIPTSVQQQYATVAETPPYSAGLLTNSSLDYSLNSPDLANFPTTTIAPIMSYTTAEEQNMANWMFNTNNSTYTLDAPLEGKGADFTFQHEFDPQQMGDIHTTRRQDRATPRHYAFENRGQHDFAFQ